MDTFHRRVNMNGSVKVDNYRYYVCKGVAGQRVLLILDADTRQFDAWVNNQQVKTMPTKGIFHGEMDLPDYVDYMTELARSEAKRLRQKQRRTG